MDAGAFAEIVRVIDDSRRNISVVAGSGMSLMQEIARRRVVFSRSNWDIGEAVELPASFTETDGSVVVNFGILTGREATIAEIDRLARSVALAGGHDIRIVAQRTHDYGDGVETVVHQVVARAGSVSVDEVERLATLWVHECAADRHVAPL